MDYHRGDVGGGDYDVPPRQAGVLRRYDKSAMNNRNTASNIKRRPQQIIDEQTQRLEQEAYRSVLRAFGAQSDDISWVKECLMTDLRKELRVTDEQHRELLGKVANDDILRQIREWRSGPAASFYQEQPRKKQRVTVTATKPSGRKKNNKKTNGEEETYRAGGAGVLKKLGDGAKAKTPKIQAVVNAMVKKEEVELPSLQALTAQIEQLEHKMDKSKVFTLMKVAEEHKRIILEGLAEIRKEDEKAKMENEKPAVEANPEQQGDENNHREAYEPGHEDG